MGQLLGDGLLAFLALVNVALAAFFCCLTPLVGVALVGVSIVLNAVLLTDTQPIVYVRGISLYLGDGLMLVLLGAALVRLLYLMRNQRVWAFLLFAALMLWSVGRGAAQYGTGVAFEARRLLYYLVPIAYFSSFRYTEATLRKVVQTLTVGAGGLLLVAVSRWLIVVVSPGQIHYWTSAISGSEYRVLNAGQTLFLAEALLIVAVPVWMGEVRAAGFSRAMLWLLPPAVLLLQHRSVWLVLISGLFWLLMVEKRQNPKLVNRFIAGALFAGAAVGIVLLASEAVQSSLVYAVQEPFQDHSTLQWRVVGWLELIKPQRLSLGDYIWGQPVGAGYLRKIWGSEVNTLPHNYYVQILLRMGSVGLAAFLTMYGKLVHHTRATGQEGSARTVLSVLLVVQLLYFLAYGPELQHGAIVGISLGLLSQYATPSRREPSGSPILLP